MAPTSSVSRARRRYLHAAVGALAFLAAPFSGAQRPAVSLGHTGLIYQALPSPDGKRLFTTDDKSLRVWDIETGKEIRPVDVEDDERGPWSLQIDAEAGLLLTTRQHCVTARDLQSLELRHIKCGPTPQQRTRGAWDPVRKRYYAFGEPTGGSPYLHVDVYTPGRDKEWKLVGTKLLATPTSTVNTQVHSVVVLPDNRLWLGTTTGNTVLEAESLSILSHDAADVRKLYSGHGDAIYATRGSVEDHTYGARAIERIDPKTLQVAARFEAGRNTIFFSGPHAYDPKRKLIWVPAGGILVGLDPVSLEKRSEVTAPGGSFIMCMAKVPNPDGDDWVLTDGHRVFTYDLEYKQYLTEFNADPFKPRFITTAPEGYAFAASDGYDAAKYVRLGPKGPEVEHAKRGFDKLAFHPRQPQFAFSSNTGTSLAEDPRGWRDLAFQPPDGANGGYASHLIYSRDGTRLLVLRYRSFSVFDTATQTELFKTEFDFDPKSRFRPAAISEDNNVVVLAGDNSTLCAYDLKEKRQLWKITAVDGIRHPSRDLLFFPAADVFACVESGKLEYRALKNGSLIFDTQLPSSLYQAKAATISPDQRYLAFAHNTNVHVMDAETGESVFSQGVSWADVTAVEFFADCRHIVAGSEDGLFRIWDTKAQKAIFTVALFGKSEEWVAISPDFRFDASRGALESVYLLRDDTVLPMEALFEKLYTPKLTARLMAGESIPPPDAEIMALKPAPNVRLELADGTRNLSVEDDVADNEVEKETIRVKVVADAGNAQLEEIRLYHNGKLLHTSAGNGAKGSPSFDVTLTPGENLLRAFAINHERTESRPADLPLIYKPKLAPIVSKEPKSGGGLQLHLLVVGVNAYANPKYNLNYAVADATAVREVVERQTKTIFTATNVQFILDAQAQKNAITSAFRNMAAKAGSRDVFVFYYAGHGVMTQEAKPEFFLVPHDVTQLYGADDALRQKGISAAELQELAKIMPAQKQLFILDACQSAGALKTVAMRGAAEEKAIAQLARSTGTHWLTASGSEQFATEFEQLGHGAFTYVLLDALNGKADTGDGRVTVNELKAYLETQVPEVTQKYKGTPQFPSSYGYGQDFPVAVVK